MSIDGYIESWEVRIKLEKETLYEKQHDREFEIKQLDAFYKKNMHHLLE